MTARVSDGDFRVLGEEVQDENMEEIGEHGRPPGDPPDAPDSWVKKVLGCNEGGMHVPEEIVDESFVESNLKLEFPNGEDGEPVITIGEKVLIAMNGLWKRCMIVKVLGRSIPLLSLTRRLKELWKPAGSMFVMDLPKNFFMVRFGVEEEYMNALSGVPWRAFGSYLMVQAWTPEFDPLRDEIVTTPVWVCLAHIAVNFYHKTILMEIAKGLGKPIKVDCTTLKVERARFARICVEINLNKPLKGTMMINGERYCVSYEGISTICSSCGMYGHLAYSCPRKVLEETPINVVVPVDMTQKNTEVAGMDTDFIPVRQMRKGLTQNGQRGVTLRSNESREMVGNKTLIGSKSRGARQESMSEEIRVSNRFGGLNVEEYMEEQVEESGNREENKENENTTNIVSGGASKETGKEFSFGKYGNRGNQQPARLGPKDQKISNMRGPNPPKTKLRNVGPMRGLVFGPISGESGMSARGKSLRVEKENVGRPGGVFAGDGELDRNEKNSEHVYNKSNAQEKLAEMENLEVDEAEASASQGREVLESVVA